ncbi:36001_t:CDS:10, partial [Gigaspora margarita]
MIMGKSKSSLDIKKYPQQERHVDWMLACPDPTPLAFFRFIFPYHRRKASEKYKKVLDLASKEAVNEESRNKFEKMKKSATDERILKDWETWMQQKTAILVRRGVHNTNLNLHEEINTLSLSKDGSSAKTMKSNPDSDTSEDDLEEEDQEEEESADEIDKFFMDTGNNEKIRNSVISNDIGNVNLVKRIEESSSTCQRLWILRSGTNVGYKLASHVKTIPEAQKCLNLAYWNILDLTENSQIKSLFSTNDWEEMIESFNNEVKLIESDLFDVIEYFFDEVEKITKEKNDKDVINAIDRLTPEIIEMSRKVELKDEEKSAENLERIDSPVSEADFNNAFPNMLAKRFLNSEELKMDVGEIACWASACRRNEGRSVVLRARTGQKYDFRGTLKKSVNKLEALIGLRSENSKAPSSDIHSTFVFGIHSWGWVHNIYGMDCKATNLLRLGNISYSKMPNTLKKLSILESFYVLFTDLQATLNTICEHTNNVSLAHSHAHRNRKRKNLEQADEKGGSFGNPSQTPTNKKSMNYNNYVDCTLSL